MIILNKPGILINKYIDIQLFVSRLKKTWGLFEKNLFKFIIPNNVVIFKKISSNIQVFILILSII